MRAKVGSWFNGDTFLNILRMGMRLSLAMACNSLGALQCTYIEGEEVMSAYTCTCTVVVPVHVYIHV